MPSTSNLSDCRKTRMACWSLVPGPRASWSTMTLIFWAEDDVIKATESARASASLGMQKFNCSLVASVSLNARLRSIERIQGRKLWADCTSLPQKPSQFSLAPQKLSLRANWITHGLFIVTFCYPILQHDFIFLILLLW